MLNTIFIIFVGVGFGAIAHAQSRAAALVESSQRMMTLKFSDGQPAAEEIPVYPVGPLWYLPLGELLSDLGVVVDVRLGEGAEGAFLNEKRKFSLDLKDCRLSPEGRPAQAYDCDLAVVHDDDIYVSTELLQSILPLKVDVNSLRSEVVVDSSEPLERSVRGGRRRRSGRYDPGYPRLEVPDANFDGFFMNQQLSHVVQSLPNKPPTEFRHDTIVTGELLGMEALYSLSGHEDKIERRRVTFSKRSIEGELLGGAGAREFQLVDVTFPTVPLIGGGGLFSGAVISSFPLQATTAGQVTSVTSSSQYGIKDFSGDLPAGWEVELYQNDVLIDRRSPVGGRYAFLNIPLNFGVNRFRLAFHGPQGQKREEFETYSIDSSFLQPGDQAYRVGIADDLGLNARWLAQYDRGLAKNVNLSTVATRFSPNLALYPPVTYGLLGVRAYVSDILLGGSAATSEGGGWVVDQSVQVPYRTSSVGVGYTHLVNYTSELFALDPVHHLPEDIYRANLTFDLFSARTVRLTLEGSRTVYQDKYSKDLFTNRASTATGPVKWFNTVNYDQSAAIQMNGELTAQTAVGAADSRLIMGYDAERVNGATLDLRYKLSDMMNLRLGWVETFKQNLRQHLVNLTRQFSHFALTANLSVDNQAGYAIGVLLSYSLEREPRGGSWIAQPKPQAEFGAVSIFVFNDLNQNGQQEADEPSVQGIEIVLNQQDTGVKTDSRGIAVLDGLRVEEPADISLSLASLPSQQVQVFPKGFRVYPRPGKMAKIDFAIEASSSIAGLVRVRRSDGRLIPKRGIRVRLKTSQGKFLRNVLSDSDGLYFFDDVAAGDYLLDLDPSQMKALRLRSDDPERRIVIRPEGTIDDNQDFTLEAGGR